MWGYLWGFTIAQIELLAIDAPIIVYGKRKKSGNKNTSKVNPPANKFDIESKVKEWKDKYENKETPVVIDLSGYK